MFKLSTKEQQNKSQTFNSMQRNSCIMQQPVSPSQNNTIYPCKDATATRQLYWERASNYKDNLSETQRTETGIQKKPQYFLFLQLALQ